MAQQSDTVGIPKRLPLAAQPANRDDTTDKDSRLVNCYLEKTPEGEIQLYKRAGLSESALLSKTGVGRGMYNWRGSVYQVTGGTLYKDGVSIGSVNNGGMYHFSEDLGSTPALFLDNRTTAYEWDDTTLTTITDPDFPANRVAGSAYLDGTTYVGTIPARLYGDDIDDMQAWDPLNFLTARIEPDDGVAVAKQLVYVIFFKQWTTEVFYDAANATGSPLGTVQGAKVSYGCANGESVQSVDDMLIWVSTTKSAQAQVVMMVNLKAEIVSTPPVERLLNHADLSTVYSFILKDEGHTFYVFTVVNENLTLVFDMRERAWWQWTDADGNYAPFVASTFGTSRQRFLQHATNGKVYAADRAYTNDAGAVIPVDGYTPNWDGGIDRRKQCNRLHVVADQEAGSQLLVRHNDFDYDPAKWSRFRAVDLGRRTPMLTDLGTFKRRAHNFRHVSDTRLRLRAIDLTLDVGTL